MTMYGWYDHGYGWGWMVMMGVIMLLVLVALIAAVILLLRRYPATRQVDNAANEALRVLRDRFARGEIDEEEYVRRRDHLRQ
jgi:putative membrane protein